MSNQSFVSFDQFITNVQAAVAETHFSPKGLASTTEFDKMKAHILGLYENVQPVHTFVDEGGAHFDCIPMEQQPSFRKLKASGHTLASAPAIPQSPAQVPGEGQGELSAPQHPFAPGIMDDFGNERLCPEGCIPLRRVDLQTLSRFKTLGDFLSKHPEGKGRAPQESDPSTESTSSHRWAHAYRNQANYGGASYLNLWDPTVTSSSIFSLSQQWWTGGSGSALQTVEGGWQVYPRKYGTSLPCLFIFYTPDDYSSGCYNLDCSAFVQTNSSWGLGMALPSNAISQMNGSQYAFQMVWEFFGGNWWLGLNWYGQNLTWIGYYPKSVFKSGQLSHHAEKMDFGGETVVSTVFPPMGSGQFANQGFKKAAFQTNIYYFDSSIFGHYPSSMTVSQHWPDCYTCTYGSGSGLWTRYIYFGGPGGNNC